MDNVREYMIAAYLDYCNNYLTVDKWAEDNGLTHDEAKAFLQLAMIVADHGHPDS